MYQVMPSKTARGGQNSVVPVGVGDRMRVQEVGDPLVDRHPAASGEDEDGDDQAPEVQVLAVAEGVVGIRRPAAQAMTEQEQPAVAGIDQRVNRLGEHRGAAGEERRGELRARDRQVAGDSGQHDRRRVLGRHFSSRSVASRSSWYELTQIGKTDAAECGWGGVPVAPRKMTRNYRHSGWHGHVFVAMSGRGAPEDVRLNMTHNPHHVFVAMSGRDAPDMPTKTGHATRSVCLVVLERICDKGRRRSFRGLPMVGRAHPTRDEPVTC